MKTAILVLMSLLLASAVYAANGANLRNVDIIGSRLNNIQICSDDVNLADTDIVGSTIANIEVSSPEKPHEKHTCEKTDCYWDPRVWIIHTLNRMSPLTLIQDAAEKPNVMGTPHA